MIEGKVNIGKVTRLHGYKGELSLKLDPEYSDLFEDQEYVFLELNKKPVPHFIDAVRYTAQGYALVFFEGVTDQATAERLRGAFVYVDAEAIPAEYDENSIRRFSGYQVIDISEGDLGLVSSVVEHPGNSFLVIDREDGEVLIPLIDPIIKEIDDEHKIIRIEAPDGLISLNLE
jgi:16S rRNA processing protein RimM